MGSSQSPRGLVLAVDGSCRDQPVILLVEGDGGVRWQGTAGDSRIGLVTAVQEAMVGYRREIAGVVAVRGPGSYMGVRSGLAAGLGAAQSLGCPISLVASLEVVASQADPATEPVLAIADAGRGGTYGQSLEPAGGGRRWRPSGPAQLLGREQSWPDSWAEAGGVVGVPGAGRELSTGAVRLELVRDRAQALAWIVAAGPGPIRGYDRVSADYAEPLGAG